MLKNWFKIFVYHFKNNKLFSLLTILGLALGISGVILSVLYWNDEHSYDAWNPNKDSYHLVSFQMGFDDIWSYSPAPLGPALQMSVPEVETFSFLGVNYFEVLAEANGKKTLLEKVFQSDSTFFEIIPFELIVGNQKTILKEKNSIALSEKVARQLFGDDDPLGQTINIGDFSFNVTGVYKIRQKSSYEPSVVLNSILNRLEQEKDDWNNYNYSLFLKLREGTDVLKTQNIIDEVMAEHTDARWAAEEGISLEEYYERHGKNPSILTPLSKNRLHSLGIGPPEGKGNYQLLLTLVGLSILILILSVVNYINLATANAIKRAKEVGMRKIIGATKRQIIFQFLFETAIYLIIAILLALSLVELSLPFYNDFLQKELTLHLIHFAPQLIGIFLITLVLAGFLPALYVANFEALKTLNGNFTRSKIGIGIRNTMLVAQFVIASLFIIGSYIVREQVRFMTTQDLGFKGDQVLIINYMNKNNEGNNYDKYLVLKDELRKIEGINEVSATAFKFGNGAININGFLRESDEKLIRLYVMTTDVNFFDMMDIKILEGRNLSDELATDTITSVLLNKTAVAQYFEGSDKEVIGSTIEAWERHNIIVGVVDDFNVLGFKEEIPPMIFSHFKLTPWMHHNLRYIYVKLASEKTEEVLTQLEQYWKENVTADYAFEYDFVDKAFARTYQEYITQNKMFSALNIMVVCIALFGLFALASYSMERRMKEIAIRKTLGASVETLLKNLTLQYVIFCVIGFAIAVVPTHILLRKWLENFAYRIDISWIPFAVGFIVLLFLTLLIVLSKAYQATKVDVLKYLKYE